ncbi:hypothetical protein BDV93DRAFT_602656 [Ceratobasidium sp. AG-I]|nr:hypothetical protein BDV93DRAFT_602656 [Ceratobasidium sp. AG-I]
MRNFGIVGVAAAAGLLSHGALAIPVPPRVVYPYPIYRSNEVVSFASEMFREPVPGSKAGVEMSSAAFSKAIDVGFMTVVIRPYEHLVSFLRYHNPENRIVLDRITNNFKRSPNLSINPPPRSPPSKSNMAPRDEASGPGAQTQKPEDGDKTGQTGEQPGETTGEQAGEPGGKSGADPGTGPGEGKKGYPNHDYRSLHDRLRSDNFSPGYVGGSMARSSTHSTSGEHIKAREVDDHPPRQPPVHNPE